MVTYKVRESSDKAVSDETETSCASSDAGDGARKGGAEWGGGGVGVGRRSESEAAALMAATDFGEDGPRKPESPWRYRVGRLARLAQQNGELGKREESGGVDSGAKIVRVEGSRTRPPPKAATVIRANKRTERMGRTRFMNTVRAT